MSFILPFPKSTITSFYGRPATRPWGDFHYGVDFAPSYRGGEPIKAPRSGVVTAIEYSNARGYQIQIDHSAALRTRYHMVSKSMTVQEGEPVQQGQIIGWIADQSYSSAAYWTGPHLHFEVRVRTTNSSGSASGAWFTIDPLKNRTAPGNDYYPQSPNSGSWAGVGDVTPIEPVPQNPAPTPDPPKPPKERNMYAVIDSDTGHRFTIGNQFIRHESSTADANVTTGIVNPDGSVYTLTTYQLRRFLISCGIPPRFVDPAEVPANEGGKWWSRDWEIQKTVNNINSRG